jgi:hypothetical protein
VFKEFFSHAGDNVKAVIENIQFHHKCSEGARAMEEVSQDADTVTHTHYEAEETDIPEIDCDVEGGGNNHFASLLTEEDVQKVVNHPFSGCKQLYAKEAVDIGVESGALACSKSEPVHRQSCQRASREQIEMFPVWDDAMKGRDDEERGTHNPEHGQVEEESAFQIHSWEGAVSPTVYLLSPNVTGETSLVCRDLSLNEQQYMAYDIVTSHLKAFLRGENPPQCLMIVHGQGGTGKSAMLNAISKKFNDLGATHLLTKTATSGVAASLIGGQTLHSWGVLPTRKLPTEKWVTHPSKEVEKQQKQNMGVLWLTVDEMSMLTTPLQSNPS